MTQDYQEFLDRKSQVGTANGFEPLWLPSHLFDFQRNLTEWSIRKGRCALYEDCGLGKTLQQLVWSQNVAQHTNKPVLVLTPLAVASQTVREGDKFGIECYRSKEGKFPSTAKIVVANYDRLHLFYPSDFVGLVADESACVKNFDAQRTAEVTEFTRTLPFRLLCTATAAPNDYVELGTSAEVLGELGHQDMITRFFKKGQKGGHLAGKRETYTLRPHAEHDFWRWVCFWARAIRKPSDLGFEDGKFILPPLITEEHVITARNKRAGVLFDMPAITLEEQREERRRTMPERCEKAASLVADTGKPAICWCHLNPEGDLLTKLIPGAVQISGSDSEESKEEKILAFISGQIRTVVSKEVLLGYGLNLQHCAHETFFASHSFMSFYQAVRRCWRFGQENPVKIDVVISEGEHDVLDNLNRKAKQADTLFAKLVELMNDHLKIDRSNPFTNQSEVPQWLQRQDSLCQTNS